MYDTQTIGSALVIAPTSELRHSLAFLLTAEGFGVDVCSLWPPESNKLNSDIVVLDEASLARRFSGDADLLDLGARLVLLSNRPDLVRQLPRATVVRKPLLDRALIDAVHIALAEAAASGDQAQRDGRPK